MKLNIVNKTNYYLVIKVRVYFGGFGGASNVPIYVYSPNCKDYSTCPPQNCKPVKVYKTDERGFAIIEIPKIAGKWILAAIADPAHRVCKIVKVEEQSIEVSSEKVIPPLIDILKVHEYIGALIGITILTIIAFLSKLFVKSRKWGVVIEEAK